MLNLDLDIKFVKGVGERRAKLLASELGVNTVRDMLFNVPKRYVDRTKLYSISEFEGEMPSVQVAGSFISFRTEGEGAKKRLIGVFSDGRSLMEMVWFSKINSIKEAYRTHRPYIVFGKPTMFNGAWSIAHPEVEDFNPDRPPSGFRGIYSLTEAMRRAAMSSRTMQSIVRNILESDPVVVDTLPPEVLAHFRLMPLREALAAIHLPENAEKLRLATRRLKFEELFYIQLNLLRFSKTRGLKIKGAVFDKVGPKFNDFYSRCLPFELTGAQKRVVKQIRADMRTGRQMNRLLQGDVGSGKTLVAFLSMLLAVDNGFQAALMAPTEILATQHYESLSPWCGDLGIGIELLTGSTGRKKRREIDAGLRDGSISIIVGTHALLEDNVEFANLGLAVIDEQHRFGVAQRAKMWVKATMPPHMLVMTATPIPRTLAMTVYGDLDVSVIDELPPGRTTIATSLCYDDRRYDVEGLMFHQLREGRQIYVVFPLIHENEKLDLKSLEENLDYLRDKFHPYKVAYVHGQMKADEKQHQMDMFVSGEASVMVATTVIEVGVNVPNATVMVIENAERFGLAQLHQLRGRVGRGADRSFCVLMSKRKIAAPTRKRLELMTETTDGFRISEADMQMRGPGDVEGTMQSGLPFKLRISDLAKDGPILEAARDLARSIIDSNPGLTLMPEGDRQTTFLLSLQSVDLLRRELAGRFANSADWSQIS